MTMKMASRQTLARAIALVLGVQGSLRVHADPTPPAGQAEEQGGALQEILVTATRRSQNMQDVPIAMTALTAETLGELHIETFDDYLKYLPNVSAANAGPGQSEIYMRGLSTTQAGNQISGGVGSFPNVAVYLDDQSVQLPGRNLDVYAADLERIEVLEGPQGTLYGAGAQAGAIRYITNKPKLNAVEVNVQADHSITAHGGPSNSVQAVLNVPLGDSFALRAVIYDDKRGGYINNVPGTFARSNSDLGVVQYFNSTVPASSATLSNAGITGNGINTTRYQGGRVSALYQATPDWSFTLQESYQKLVANGVFSYEPSVGDLETQLYNPSGSTDRFNDVAWSMNARLGPLKAVYTGGFLDRRSEQTTDYTDYTRGIYADYYQCNGPSLPNGTGSTDRCFSPSAVWHDVERNTHQTHEVRLSSPDELRWRAIGGLYWEDFKIQDSENFDYGEAQAGFGQTLAPLPGTTQFDPSPRPVGTVFFSDITRGYKQKAAFGELAFDIVPKALTLTVGTRLYHIDNYERGSKNSAYGCRFIDPCTTPPGSSVSLNQVTFANGTTGPLATTDSGHKSKVNLSWKPTDDVMLYLTYSEGFRPGGFNRGQGIITSASPLFGKLTIPTSYTTDQLKNYEFGWKTQWLNHRLQFNGTLYEERWSNVQLTVLDPALYGNIDWTTNGPNYRVRGLETEASVKAPEHLTVTATAAWNRSEQINDPKLIGNDGVPVSVFPTAGVGSPLAQSPPFQGSLRARYEVPIESFETFVQVAAHHTAHSYASVLTVGAFEPPNQQQNAYSTYDAAVGISRDSWNVQFYGDNLTDTRAQLYVSGFNFVNAVTPNRPRSFGLRIAYKFSTPRG